MNFASPDPKPPPPLRPSYQPPYPRRPRPTSSPNLPPRLHLLAPPSLSSSPPSPRLTLCCVFDFSGTGPGRVARAGVPDPPAVAPLVLVVRLCRAGFLSDVAVPWLAVPRCAVPCRAVLRICGRAARVVFRAGWLVCLSVPVPAVSGRVTVAVAVRQCHRSPGHRVRFWKRFRMNYKHMNMVNSL